MPTLKQRVQLALQEDVTIVPYDPAWPELFRLEAVHLRACLPPGLIRRIEHFGSTAVPGLAAKPIIDILVEVTSLRAARTQMAPILKAQGYDYFWRPTIGDDVPPWYAFFIKRDQRGTRTHHIHMITRRPVFQEHWERLLFRDYLVANSKVAAEYEQLKKTLAAAHANDRFAYTFGKTDFIVAVIAKAKTSGPRLEQPFPVPPDTLSAGQVSLQFVKVVPGEPARGIVPYYHFRILVAEGVEVGHINFRVGDTEHVRNSAGHIGFEILAPFRGHGYALQACRALAPFVAYIYDVVTITCDPDNHASRRTIEGLGACFIDEVIIPTHDPQYQKGSRCKRRYKWMPGFT